MGGGGLFSTDLLGHVRPKTKNTSATPKHKAEVSGIYLPRILTHFFLRTSIGYLLSRNSLINLSVFCLLYPTTEISLLIAMPARCRGASVVTRDLPRTSILSNDPRIKNKASRAST